MKEWKKDGRKKVIRVDGNPLKWICVCFKTASAPVFSTNPVRLIATVGKDVSLECRPRASPKPRISWRKNDRRVQPSRRWVWFPAEVHFCNCSCFAWKWDNYQDLGWSSGSPLLRVCVYNWFQLNMPINTHTFTWICVHRGFNQCSCPMITGLTLGWALLRCDLMTGLFALSELLG